jgi:hypothetical protein
MLDKLIPPLIQLIGALFGALIVVLGWIRTHQLTIEREIAAKRRDQHLTYLVPAYRTLAKWIPYNRAGRLDEIDEEFQKAIADIQFFGSTQQIQLVGELVDSLVNRREFNPEPLLVSLRDDLRRELDKEKVSGPIHWLGLYRYQKDPIQKG